MNRILRTRTSIAEKMQRPDFWKRLAFVSVWVLASILIATVASSLRPKNVFFFFDAEKTEFFQVFYPVNENLDFAASHSERYAYDSGGVRSLAFLPPNPLPATIRIDPSDHAAGIYLKRVEVSGLFSKAVLQPEEVQSRLRVFQSVDKVEIRGDALFINANDVDPIMTLNLSGLVYEHNSTAFILFVISTTIIGFCICGSALSVSIRRRIALFSIPFAFAVLLTFVFFPGYMSYDSLHALRGARSGVTDSAWPPLVSYVWRMVELVCPHPSAMLFSQILLLFTSTAVIVFHYTRRIRYVLLSLGVALVIPVVLGTVAAIWKDVLMASFFLAAFAITLQIRSAGSRRRILGYACLAAIFLFCGTAARHNAVTATLPLAVYLSWELALALDLRRKLLATTFMAVGSLALMFSLKLQLDSYSLPELNRISGMTDLVPVVRKMDIVAASICADENLLENVAPGLTLDDMREGYDARHSINSMTVLNKIPTSAEINSVWLDVMKEHPFCFLSNKAQLTAFLTGAHSGEQFLVVSPDVNQNEFGYGLPRVPLRSSIENYILDASDVFVLKPWFLYVTTTTLFAVFAVRRRRIDSGVLTCWLSAVSYAGGLVMFGNAADARLLFYTNFLMVMLPVMLVSRSEEDERLRSVL